MAPSLLKPMSRSKKHIPIPSPRPTKLKKPISVPRPEKHEFKDYKPKKDCRLF